MHRPEAAYSAGLLALRMGFGGFMACHGWGKVELLFSGAVQDFDPIGLGYTPTLVLAIGAEFCCSLLVMLGLFTRIAAVPVVATMAVAAFVVHANDPWLMRPDGGSKEPAMLFLLAFLTLVFTGAGRHSLDQALQSRRRTAPLPPGGR